MRYARLLIPALVALPASGDNLSQELSPAEKHALTPIDTVPTRASLDNVLQGPGITRLKEIALAPAPEIDFGIRLRAIRALPHYCSSMPCRSDGVATGDAAHLALREIYDTLSPTDHSGQAILRLRATLEALGATRSGLTQDVNLVAPFLSYASRDIRVAAAHALRELCNQQAIDPLQKRHRLEQIPQVRLAISRALSDLRQCGQ